jgi:endonuclease/exonuclease/phosphatase family metal-dependent hydrolase
MGGTQSSGRGGDGETLAGLLSYNVWFDEYEKERRAASLFALIAAARPAVVALQEVTPSFLALLLKEDWAQHRYAFSTTDVRMDSCTGGVSPYGSLLLVAKSLKPVFRAIELPTIMGRALVLAYLTLPSGAQITAATVHLESLSSQPVREQQLRKIARVLSGAPAVLCGDFNFDARRNWSDAYSSVEDGLGLETRRDNECLAEILTGWVDMWAAQHPTEHGFTFDSESNPNAKRSVPRHGEMTYTYEQMRYDRVMVGPGLLSAAADATIELVGVESDKSIGCHISDHFGLLAHIDFDSVRIEPVQQLLVPRPMPVPVPPVPPPLPPPAVNPAQLIATATASDGGLSAIDSGAARQRLRPTKTVFTSKDGTKRTVVGLATAGDDAETVNVEKGDRPQYLQSNSEKQLDGTPTPRFDVDDPQAMEFLDQHGYVVIASAASATEIAEQTDNMWSFLESLGGRSQISRADPRTWEEGWPGSQTNGIITGHGFNHTEFMWSARTNLVVLKAFGKVWDVSPEELIASFDGGNVFRPTDTGTGGRPEWTTQGGWWHVDQNSLNGHSGKCTVQGLLTYTDADDTTGGLCVVPASHHHHDELCARASAPGGKDFVLLPPSDPLLSQPGKLVTARAGDLILWDSRTVHCNTPATSQHTQQIVQGAPALKRIVAYVCHVPKTLANPATIALRQMAYCSNTGTTHWPQHVQLGASGDVFGLAPQKLEDTSDVVRRLVGEFVDDEEPEPSAEAMQAMSKANAAEAEGDLGEAQRWLKEAERLGHSLLAKHGGWR